MMMTLETGWLHSACIKGKVAGAIKGRGVPVRWSNLPARQRRGSTSAAAADNSIFLLNPLSLGWTTNAPCRTQTLSTNILDKKKSICPTVPTCCRDRSPVNHTGFLPGIIRYHLSCGLELESLMTCWRHIQIRLEVFRIFPLNMKAPYFLKHALCTLLENLLPDILLAIWHCYVRLLPCIDNVSSEHAHA